MEITQFIDETTKEAFDRLGRQYPELKKLPQEQFLAIFQAGVWAQGKITRKLEAQNFASLGASVGAK